MTDRSLRPQAGPDALLSCVTPLTCRCAAERLMLASELQKPGSGRRGQRASGTANQTCRQTTNVHASRLQRLNVNPYLACKGPASQTAERMR